MTESNQDFTHAVTTRWIDSDAFGHVNNAVFLTYLEEARDAWFLEYLGRREIYIVARIEINFLHELSLDARHVVVEISPVQIGRKSIVLSETAYVADGGDALTRSLTTVVRWDMEARRTVELTDAERTVLRPLVRT